MTWMEKDVFELLNERGKHTLTEIKKELGVSYHTVRQALDILRKKKIVKQIKEGAHLYYYDIRGEA